MGYWKGTIALVLIWTVTGAHSIVWARGKAKILCPSEMSALDFYRRQWGQTDVVPNKAQLEILFSLKENAQQGDGSVTLQTVEQGQLLSQVAGRRLVVGSKLSSKEFENLLYRAFYRLAFEFAHRKSKSHPRVDLDDLVQAAVIGLMKAMKQYSSDSPYMFSTYAWKAMMREVSELYPLYEEQYKVGKHGFSKYTRILRIRDELSVENPVPPSNAAIMEKYYQETGKLVSQKAVENAIYRNKLARMVRAVINNDNFYDETGNEDYRREISSAKLAESDLDSPTVAREREEVLNIMTKLSEKLGVTTREKVVMSLYFGVEFLPQSEIPWEFDPNGMTFDAIGSRMSITRERARQIFARGVRKLRYSSGLSRWLAVYLRKDTVVLKTDAREAVLALTSAGLTPADARALYWFSIYGF